MASTTLPDSYSIRRIGPANTVDHRVYVQDSTNSPISVIHDVPLYSSRDSFVVRMVVTVPRWTNAKYQASLGEPLNPVKQDARNGKLRYVRNCFPHHGYIWNYGILPQTWEDPAIIHPDTKAKGDNYCLDVCEIGEQIGYTGQIKEVKVLGIMSLLDDEQTDWKVVVIDVNDPFAPRLNSIEDVELNLPGLLRATNEWFRVHEIPDGKPEKQFAFTGECKNKGYTMDVIKECHDSWRRLVLGNANAEDISLANTSVRESPFYLTPEQVPAIDEDQDLQPAKTSSTVDKWFFFGGFWQ